MGNGFFNDNESSLERGNPLSQAAKNASKATSAQAQQQRQALNKQIVDQLYGNSPAAGEGGDDADALTQQVKQAQSASPQAGSQGSSPLQGPQEAGDQAKLDETRARLASMNSSSPKGGSGLHRNQMPENIRKTNDYVEETFGENAKRRREQERQQALQQKEQEEEEERQQKEEEKEQQDQELAELGSSPKGKMGQKGRNKMQAPKTPIALKRAQTKAESSRGTVG